MKLQLQCFDAVVLRGGIDVLVMTRCPSYSVCTFSVVHSLQTSHVTAVFDLSGIFQFSVLWRWSLLS